METIISQIIGDIWTSNECCKNLQLLCDKIGSRFSGSKGEREARDFILNKFKEYSLDRTYLEQFEYSSWQREAATLKIVKPIKKEIRVLSLGNVPSTDSQGVMAEIVFIGYGTAEEFERYKEKISGKIILCHSGNPFGERKEHQAVKVYRASRLGAKALLLIGRFSGGVQQVSDATLGKISEIPVASISKEDGEYLKRFLEENSVKVNLYLKNRIKDKISWNIIGEIRGQEKPAEEIVVAAHYDCWDICPGALDNASGATVVMELARIFAKYKSRLKRTIKFICFSAEEIGLLGSKAYVSQHRKTLKKIILMLNIDPAGRIVGYKVEGFAKLLLYLETLSEKINFPICARRSVDYNQDSFPFMINGVPAVWLQAQSRPNDGFLHSPGDTVDKITPYDLKEAIMVAAYIILDIVNVHKPPEKYKSQKEVKKWLEADPFLVETLKLIKSWPFTDKR